MSESVILELNQRFAEWSKEGEYKITFAQPTVINEGDTLSFRMASLDVDKSQANDIVIEEDTQLTMIYSYFDVDYDLRDKSVDDQSAPWAGNPGTAPDTNQPTFDFYAAYNERELEEMYNIYVNINGFIPTPSTGNQGGGSYIVGTGGDYSDIDPAHNLVITFSYIDPSGNLQYLQTSGDFVEERPPNPSNPGTFYQAPSSGAALGQFPLYVNDPPWFDSIQRAGPDNGPIVFRKGTFQVASTGGAWPGAYKSQSDKTLVFPNGSMRPGLGGATTGYAGEYPYTPDEFSFVYTTQSIGKANRALDVNVQNIILPAGRYDPSSLATKMTQLLSNSNGLVPSNPSADDIFAPNNPLLGLTTDPIHTDLVWRRVDFSANTPSVTFNNTNTYRYYNVSEGQIEPYFFGASLVALEYGKAGGIFQVSYMHTPFNDPQKPGEQDIGIFHYYRNGNVRYKVVKSASGVFFHDLQPESFWEGSLGLRSKLIVPLQNDSQGYQYYTPDSIKGKYTEGFQSLSSFLLAPTPSGTNYPNSRKFNPSPPSQNPVYIDSTGLSLAILGNEPNLNRSGSFYLVEIQDLFRRTGAYIDTEENNLSISAIVSTAYSADNTVTAFQDSGIPYVHRGPSYVISSATVRILDPVTKQPVTNLGLNNTIWIQIEKLLQEEQAMPVVEQPLTQTEQRGREKM